MRRRPTQMLRPTQTLRPAQMLLQALVDTAMQKATEVSQTLPLLL
jgi:hypothetical protein